MLIAVLSIVTPWWKQAKYLSLVEKIYVMGYLCNQTLILQWKKVIYNYTEHYDDSHTEKKYYTEAIRHKNLHMYQSIYVIFWKSKL